MKIVRNRVGIGPCGVKKVANYPSEILSKIFAFLSFCLCVFAIFVFAIAVLANFILFQHMLFLPILF